MRDFHGDSMGSAKQEEGRGEREKLLGKTLFFGFFRTSFNCSDAPEGERMRGWRGDSLGALNIKKEPRNEFHWLSLSHYSNDTMRGLLETGT